MSQLRNPRPRRAGFAIPMVAGFCVILSILIGITVFLRSNANRQQKADWHGMKAQFMAQGAIQVALYKFRILPNEGFDASEAALGGNTTPLATFLSDVGTDSIGFSFTDAGTRTCNIVEGRALSSKMDISATEEIWKHVLQLEAESTVEDQYRGTDGALETRTERLTKIIEIRKVRESGT